MTFACLASIVAIVWLLVQRNLLAPLQKAKHHIGFISEGDLTHACDVDSKDELGEMIVQINQMRSNLRDLAADIVNASTTISSSSAESVKGTIDSISKDTASARDITGEAVVHTQSASERVNRLGQAAREIEKITDTITDISEHPWVSRRSIQTWLKAPRFQAK